MVDLVKSLETCCGCGACAAVCPHGAITMREDADGYVYPEVDSGRCVDCGACLSACRFTTAEKRQPAAVYAAQWRRPELAGCASGGVFSALATQTLAAGGVVFGCRMQPEDQWHPVLCKAERPEDLNLLRGSKYVWSSTGTAYREVRDALRSGRSVLFSGLPCQVAGLKGFLRRDYEGLVTVDIICHGTPPPRLFAAYVAELGRRRRGRMHDFRFRVKERGWGLYYYYYYWQGDKLKKRCREYTRSVFYRLFLSSTLYRPSCYACPFAGRGRVADLTIGDCWGIGREHPELDREKGGPMSFREGVSCVLVNSPAGRRLLEAAAGELETAEVTYESVARYNQQLNHPSPRPATREAYLAAFRHGGWRAVEWTFLRRQWYPLMKEYVKKGLSSLKIVRR